MVPKDEDITIATLASKVKGGMGWDGMFWKI